MLDQLINVLRRDVLARLSHEKTSDYTGHHTTGSCPGSTDQTPAMIAINAVLDIVIRVVVASFTITSKSDVKVHYTVCMHS